MAHDSRDREDVSSNHREQKIDRSETHDGQMHHEDEAMEDPTNERMDITTITEEVNHLRDDDDKVRRESGAKINDLTRDIL